MSAIHPNRNAPLWRASEILAERKAALCGVEAGGEEPVGGATLEDAAARAFAVGTGLRPDDLLALTVSITEEALRTITRHAESEEDVPAFLSAFVMDAIMHGYHAHRLEGKPERRRR